MNKVKDRQLVDKIDAQVEEWFHREPVLREKLAKVVAKQNLDIGILLRETLRFMTLASEAPRSLTPSPLIDQAWHELILFTRQYADFCKKNYGEFLHHQPDDNVDRNRKNYRKTLERYALVFGSADSTIWGDAADHVGVDLCGTCHPSKE